MIGQTVSHYKITQKLGEGGMGEVYLAEDTTLKRKVALKLLPETHQQDPVSHKRFIREAESAAALDHPYVCKIYEVGEHEGRNFIAMEYLKGRTLKERLADGPIPLDEALRIASEIAEALEEAHEGGIVHRDLKPANIMLTPKGHAQVLDFGLAKRVAEDGQEITTEVTREGTTLGTLAYMSPEQLRGEPVNTRSDIFALAVVLYEMLAGVHPFRKAEHVQTMAAILHREAEDLTDLIDNVPEALSQMLRKMLAKDPAERFQSVADVVEILNDPSAPWRIRGRPFFNKWAFSALMLILVLTVALVGWWALRERTSEVTPVLSSIAVLPLKNLSGDPEQEYFVDGMTEELITDLSKIRALKVTARFSAMRYKDTEKTLAEIAEELKVEAVVEGSVLREGDRVRITAQLIEAATGNNLWADRYERALTSIMALQGEVAQAIAREIRVTLTPAEEALLTNTRQVDPEAYEAYLKGQSHFGKLTQPDLETALQYYELALEKDTNYAPAYAGIALAWAGLKQFGYVPRSEATPKLRKAALKAVELDETSAEAHYALAILRTGTDCDWEGAELAYRRAIELNPNYANVRAYYSHYLMVMLRPDEARVQMERALELDPLNNLIQALYAVVLQWTGQYDEAIEVSRNILRTVPNHPMALNRLKAAYYLKGMYEESYEAEKSRFSARGDFKAVEALEEGYAKGGYRGAMSALADLQATDRLRPNPVGYPLRAGKTQQALDVLEREFEERGACSPHIGLNYAKELGDEPRFQDLLRRMNFPENVLAKYLNGAQ